MCLLYLQKRQACYAATSFNHNNTLSAWSTTYVCSHISSGMCVRMWCNLSLSLSLSLSLLPKTSPAPEDFALSRSQVDHLVCNAHVGWLSGWLASSWLAAYLYPAYPANNTNQQSQPTNLPTKPQPTEIEMGICPGCILPRFVYGKGLENVISPHLWPCTRFNLSRENAHETAMSEKARRLKILRLSASQ